MEASFGDITCVLGKYFDKHLKKCLDCSNVVNYASTSTVAGICDCAANYYWTGLICKLCPLNGCPTAQNTKNNKPTDKPTDKPSKPTGVGDGNLREGV